MAATLPRPTPSARSASVLTPLNAVRAVVAIAILIGGFSALHAVTGTGRYHEALRWSIAFLVLDVLGSWALIEFHLHPRRRPGISRRAG